MSKISHIEIDDSALPPPTPEIEQERKVAIFDLLEQNSFSLPARDDHAAHFLEGGRRELEVGKGQ